jgi:predicted dehydrogenase
MIGAGSMANQVHYPSLSSFPDVEFAGICDLRPDRLKATGDRYHIEQRFFDYQAMIEATAPDAVYVIGQPDVMYPLWTWCLQHGLNLYIEKPMALTLHQARTLAHLADKHGCLTQVSFQRRSCPMVVKLRQECLRYGPMVHAVCRFYKYLLTPNYDPRDHMMDDSVHSIDTLRWMCGGELVDIECSTKRIQVPDINFIQATLQFDSGATGVMINSWSSGRRIFAVEMHAPGVCAEAEHEGKGRLYVQGDTNGVEYDTRQVAGSDQLFVFGGFQAKNRNFIDCLRSGNQPESNFQDALKTMEIAERILALSLLQE